MRASSDIVYVDDEPDQLLAQARAAGARDRIADHSVPFTGTNAATVGNDAANANLWVFDFFNDDEQRERPDLAGASSNGLSLFQQFRLLVGDARPPAIVVSNHLEEALGSEINFDRRHILAEEVGVEWVAPKVGQGGDVMAEILSMANATATLRAASPALAAASAPEYISELARTALGLPMDVGWSRSALRDIGDWRPPIWLRPAVDQRSPNLHSELPVVPELRSVRSVVAWMIRQVLPYPSFLVSDRHVAVRLGLELACLRNALSERTELAQKLRPALYGGILADFDGRRWWAAGVDALVWELSTANAPRERALGELVAPVKLAELTFLDPVVVSDADLVETDEIAPIALCVRASDEHFPAHAPPAWVKIEDASIDRELAMKVRPEDQRELIGHK